MATEIEIDAKINTADSAKTLSELKSELKELKKLAENSEFGSEKFKELSNRIIETKEKINDVNNSFVKQAEKVPIVKNSLSELKSELKILISEQSKVEQNTPEFEKLRNAINKTEGKIADLQDGFSTLRGSGVERVNSSLALFRQGLTDADPGKLKIGLQGLGSAMSAVPIFFLIQGLQKLIENFDEVKKFVLDFASDLGFATSASSDLEKQLEKTKEANSRLSKSIEDQITALSGLEKNEKRITKLKKEQLQLTISERKLALQAAVAKELEAKNEADALEKLIRLTGNKTTADLRRFAAIKEVEKERIKATDELRAALSSLQGFENVQTQKSIDNNKKAFDKKLEYAKKYLENLKKIDGEYQENLKNKKTKEIEADISHNATISKNVLAQLKDECIKKGGEWIEGVGCSMEKHNKQQADAKLQAENNYIQSARVLSDTFFQIQLNNAEGNAQRELEIRKRMFQVDKAFNVARVIQDGIRSVQAALTIPPPAGQILAGANAALAAGNLAKILATKFNGGTSSGSGGGSVPNVSIPSVRNEAIQNNNQTDIDSQTGKVNKVFVLEKDITEKVKKVAKIQETAKFK